MTAHFAQLEMPASVESVWEWMWTVAMETPAPRTPVRPLRAAPINPKSADSAMMGTPVLSEIFAPRQVPVREKPPWFVMTGIRALQIAVIHPAVASEHRPLVRVMMGIPARWKACAPMANVAQASL